MGTKKAITIGLAVLLLSFMAVFATACGGVGANIRLEGLSLGAVSLDGKPLSGLPSDKINLEIDVAAQTVKVSFGADGTTILTLAPSEATILVKGDSVSFKGLKPEQIKVEWAMASSD